MPLEFYALNQMFGVSKCISIKSKLSLLFLCRNILKNLKQHNDEDLQKGQAVKNQKVFLLWILFFVMLLLFSICACMRRLQCKDVNFTLALNKPSCLSSWHYYYYYYYQFMDINQAPKLCWKCNTCLWAEIYVLVIVISYVY